MRLALQAALILAVALGLRPLAPGLELGRAAAGEPPAVPAKLPEPFAVLPFENRSGAGGLDWMEAAIPFILAEKAEGHGGLMPAYGPLVIPEGREAAPVDAVAVGKFAREAGARWVFSGWIERPDWKLELGVSLWRMEGKKVSRVGEVVSRGEREEAHQMLGGAIVELFSDAGAPVAPADLPAVQMVPTEDFYAFTVFGRGLAALAGTGGAADVERAEKHLERAILIDPKHVQAQRVLAELYRRSDRMGKARARIERALEVDPSYYPALTASGRLERSRGRAGSARALYERALELRPWDLEARFRLGRVLWEAGEADRAFSELSRVVKRRPGDARARRILVMIHAARGDGAGLVRELEAVVELEPDDEGARLDLAAAYTSVGREKDAIGAYEAVVERNPKHLQALKFLGDLYKRRGKLRFAIKYYGAMLEADPDDPRAYFLLGAAYVEAGNDGQAAKVYRRAMRFDEYQPELQNNLGAIAYREGALDEARWYLERAVEKRPRKVRYRYNYALALSASQKAEQALSQIAEGLRLDSEHPELHYLRGVVLLRDGKASAARDEFERTLALAPRHEGARHNLAMLEEMERRARDGEVVVE